MSSSRSERTIHTPLPRPTLPTRVRRALLVFPALLLTTAVLATVIAVAASATEAPLIVASPPLVEYGLPASKAIMNLAAAATIGGLVIASLVLPARTRAYDLVLDISATGAGAWTVSAAVAGVLTFISVAGTVAPGTFGPAIGQFFTQIAIGQAWLATILAAATLTVLCFAVRNHTAIGAVAVLGFVSLIPLALQGHAAGAGSHIAASTALWVHIAASSAWIGGLFIVILLRTAVTPSAMLETLRRYSSIALFSFIALSIAGAAGAFLRLQEPSQLISTSYGQLLSMKILLLITAGAAGAYYRTCVLRTPTSFSSRGSVLWRIVTAELVLMGVASGLAVVLARTPPPVLETIATTPAERLTGQSLPAMLTLPRALTAIEVDPLWLIASVLGLGLYGAGVWRLKRRGARWPASRTAAWVGGILLLLYVTNGAPAAYGPYLYSGRTITQVALLIPIPLLLVVGAPGTLAREAIKSRTDDSRGAPEWTSIARSSRPAKLLAHPITAAALLAVIAVLFSVPSVMRWTIEDPVGRQAFIGLTLAAGLLLCHSLAGTGRQPSSYPSRLIAAATTIAVPLLLGAWLASTDALLLPDWYGVITDGWPTRPIADQRMAGVLSMWSAAAVLPILFALRDGRDPGASARSGPARQTAANSGAAGETP